MSSFVRCSTLNNLLPKYLYTVSYLIKTKMDELKLDYVGLGFRCGLEIHQQLLGRKLFCNCPSINSDKEPDIKVERRLRAVAGELGRIDIAAKHEMAKGKKFIYVSNSEDTCLVEYDDVPPYTPSEKAIDTALQISLLLNAKIVDELQVMRKTVVDGSNTSGFQRTILVAQNGYVDTSLGKVKIPIICLEEEAAQKIKEDDKSVTYRLDRLGIPLIEIGTAADIKSPEHAKEVAAYLGMVLRSTGACKRGIGTIRQDVNISIKGGARTEIKGFQDLRSIPKVIEFEVKRQLDLIKQGKKLKEEVRKAEPNFTTSFLRPMPGADRMYVETDVAPIRITKERLDKIKVPDLISNKAEKLEKLGINKEVAKGIANEERVEYFEELFERFKELKPAFIVETFMSVKSQLKKDFNIEEEKVKDEDIEKVLELVNKNIVQKNSIVEALADIIKVTFNQNRYKCISDGEIEKEIEKIVQEKPGLNQGAYMGIIMGKLRGKVDGKRVMEILKKYI